MELVSNRTHSSLDGPFHGSFRKFLVNGKRPWTVVNADNRHLILVQPRDSRRKSTSLMLALHSHLRAVLRLSFLFGRRPTQSCNRQAIRASVNNPSNANVCRAVCLNTAFIFITYDPQITHGKQIGNRKQTFCKNKATSTHTKFQPPPPLRIFNTPFSVLNELLDLSMFSLHKYYQK